MFVYFYRTHEAPTDIVVIYIFTPVLNGARAPRVLFELSLPGIHASLNPLGKVVNIVGNTQTNNKL